MGDLPKKRYVIRVDESLTKGDKGDKGDIGPAGAGGSLPIDASNILYTGFGYVNTPLDQVIDALLYEPVNITSFIADAGTLYEAGTSLNTIVVSWTLENSLPATGSSITVTGGNVTHPAIAYDDVTVTLTSSPTLTSTTTLTLNVDDGLGLGGEDSQNLNIYVYWPVFYGQATDPGTITSTWLRQNLQKSLQGIRNLSFSTTAVVDEYAWIAFPTSYGVPSFTVNGFSADFVAIHPIGTPLTYTSNVGTLPSNSYYVFRSENTQQAQDIVVF